MAVYSIFVHPEYVRYRTSICTVATFFIIFTVLITFLGPLFMVYTSQGFWVKENTFREQPLLHYKHEVISYFDVSVSGRPDYLAWSTYQQLNSLHQTKLRVPVIKSVEADDNEDGVPDRLDLTLELPLSNNEEVHGVKLMLLFTGKLRKKSLVNFQSLGFIQHSSFLPGASLRMSGDLSLVQRAPLYHTGKDDQYNVPLFDVNSRSLEEFDFNKIINNYRKRNVSTTFDCNYPLWTTGRSRNLPFSVSLSIFYPEERIVYYTGFWELLKWAWVQYLSVLLVFAFFFKKVKTFVFSHQIFHTAVVSTCKKTV